MPMRHFRRFVLKKYSKSFILVPGYGAQGGKGADLVHYFDENGLDVYKRQL